MITNSVLGMSVRKLFSNIKNIIFEGSISNKKYIIYIYIYIYTILYNMILLLTTVFICLHISVHVSMIDHFDHNITAWFIDICIDQQKCCVSRSQSINALVIGIFTSVNINSKCVVHDVRWARVKRITMALTFMRSRPSIILETHYYTEIWADTGSCCMTGTDNVLVLKG